MVNTALGEKNEELKRIMILFILQLVASSSELKSKIKRRRTNFFCRQNFHFKIFTWMRKLNSFIKYSKTSLVHIFVSGPTNFNPTFAPDPEKE